MLCQFLVKHGDIIWNSRCSLYSCELYLDALKNLQTKLQLAWEHSEKKGNVKMNKALVNSVIVMSFLVLL